MSIASPNNNLLTGEKSRRTVLSGLAALPLAACTSQMPSKSVSSDSIEIYSPAPPNNPLHKLNKQLMSLFADEPLLSDAIVTPVALPESVNRISEMPPQKKHVSLPIVTTVDFKPARNGTGPDWHRYSKANSDLKFVSKLYDVGFGIQLFDQFPRKPNGQDLKGKRIAVPPRPSAVRMMTEALLKDGWSVLDEVTLVDMFPPQIAAARAAGEIDGTSWNLVLPQNNSFAPMMSISSQDEQLGFVPIDQTAMARVNEANDFQTSLVDLLPGNSPMISFAQALAAWDDSDPQIINELLLAIHGKGASVTGYPRSAAEMVKWPFLENFEIHAIAAQFYDQHNMIEPV